MDLFNWIYWYTLIGKIYSASINLILRKKNAFFISTYVLEHVVSWLTILCEEEKYRYFYENKAIRKYNLPENYRQKNFVIVFDH